MIPWCPVRKRPVDVSGVSCSVTHQTHHCWGTGPVRSERTSIITLTCSSIISRRVWTLLRHRIQLRDQQLLHSLINSDSQRKENTQNTLKETVHPKMNSLSSFTHPQVDPNLYECVCSEHKGRYSEECSIFLLLLKSMVPKTAWLQTFFRISSFVFRTNTFIQVWIYLRMSKWWQNFHF